MLQFPQSPDPQDTTNPSSHNKLVAVLLAWVFFGPFGSHCFYLGNKHVGTARLIAGLLIVPLPFLYVAALLEGWQYLRDSNEQFAERLTIGGRVEFNFPSALMIFVGGLALWIVAISTLPILSTSINAQVDLPSTTQAVEKEQEAINKLEEQDRQEQEESDKRLVHDIQKLENDVRKALRPHKEIQVNVFLDEFRSGVWAEFITISLDIDYFADDIMEAFKEVYISDVPVEAATIAVRAELLDKYGNSFINYVYRAEMDRSVGKRINWENKYMVDLEEVSHVDLKHPLLR